MKTKPPPKKVNIHQRSSLPNSETDEDGDDDSYDQTSDQSSKSPRGPYVVQGKRRGSSDIQGQGKRRGTIDISGKNPAVHENTNKRQGIKEKSIVDILLRKPDNGKKSESSHGLNLYDMVLKGPKAVPTLKEAMGVSAVIVGDSTKKPEKYAVGAEKPEINDANSSSDSNSSKNRDTESEIYESVNVSEQSLVTFGEGEFEMAEVMVTTFGARHPIKKHDSEQDISWVDLLIPIFHIVIYLFDYCADLFLATQYAILGNFVYCILTMSFVAMPAVVLAVWMKINYTSVTNKRCEFALTIFLLAPVKVYWDSLLQTLGLMRISGHKHQDFLRYREAIQEMKRDTDAAIFVVKMFEAFLENGPQLILQLYVMTKTDKQENLALFAGRISSIIMGLYSMVMAMIGFESGPGDSAFNCSFINMKRSLLVFFWKLFALTPRIIVLPFFMSAFNYFVLIPLTIHLIFVTFWLYLLESGEARSVCHNCHVKYWITWRIPMFMIQTMCVVNMEDKPQFYFLFMFCSHALMYLENSCMIIIWYIRESALQTSSVQNSTSLLKASYVGDSPGNITYQTSNVSLFSLRDYMPEDHIRNDILGFRTVYLDAYFQIVTFVYVMISYLIGVTLHILFIRLYHPLLGATAAEQKAANTFFSGTAQCFTVCFNGAKKIEQTSRKANRKARAHGGNAKGEDGKEVGMEHNAGAQTGHNRGMPKSGKTGDAGAKHQDAQKGRSKLENRTKLDDQEVRQETKDHGVISIREKPAQISATVLAGPTITKQNEKQDSLYEQVKYTLKKEKRDLTAIGTYPDQFDVPGLDKQQKTPTATKGKKTAHRKDIPADDQRNMTEIHIDEMLKDKGTTDKGRKPKEASVNKARTGQQNDSKGVKPNSKLAGANIAKAPTESRKPKETSSGKRNVTAKTGRPEPRAMPRR